MNVSKAASDGVSDFDGSAYRCSLHLPRERTPSVTALTLAGIALALAGSAFAAGLLVGGGMRLAGWGGQ